MATQMQAVAPAGLPTATRPPTPLRIALTLGDPNGIGPEICLKALQAAPELAARVTVFGSPMVLERTACANGLEALLATLAVEPAGELADDDAFSPGTVDARAGAATVDAATAALQACRAGRFAAVVAGPHHETAIQRAGIAFSGYPSLVAQACGLAPDAVFLLLVGGGLRVVHATLHENLQRALARITPQLVYDAAHAGIRGCALLGVARPTIGVFGINPHASEGGLWGDEDAALVSPAVARLRAEGWQADGPQGADTLLAARAHDLFVAMVHDQGHIPVKLLAPQQASAISVGADVVLASVGHGSAMDIAGRGVARPDALLRTLRLLAGAEEQQPLPRNQQPAASV